jgi:hypothetical protein
MNRQHDMTTPKMTRVTVRVPRTTLDQINNWVDTLGVRRSHFLGIALVAGVRSLIQASALEVSVSPGALATDPVAQRPPSSSGSQVSIDPEELTQVVDTLRNEVAALQSEVLRLKGELDPQRSGEERS